MSSSRGRQRVWFWGLFLGMVTMVLLGLWLRGMLPWESAQPAATAPPQLSTIDCIGLVDLEEGLLELSPSRSGRIVQIPVRESQRVAKGAVLVQLDDQSARFQVEQSSAAVNVAEARLDQAVEAEKLQATKILQQKSYVEAAKQRLSSARNIVAYKKKLRAVNMLKQEDLNAAEDRVREQEALVQAEKQALTLLQAQNPGHAVKQARASLASRQVALKQARYDLSRCALTAPEAGMVLELNVAIGEIYSSTSQTPALLFVPSRPRIIRAEIEQEFVGLIARGQPAVIRDETDFSRKWTGKVLRLGEWYSQRRTIFRQPPRTSDVATLECLIAVDPGQPLLRFGQRMIVTVSIQPNRTIP